MKRILIALILGLAALFVVVFIGDYAVLRYRMATNRSPFGSVNVSRYYAIQEKNNKTEFVFLDSQDQPCVHSIFPHRGDPACWYLSRHTTQQIDI